MPPWMQLFDRSRMLNFWVSTEEVSAHSLELITASNMDLLVYWSGSTVCLNSTNVHICENLLLTTDSTCASFHNIKNFLSTWNNFHSDIIRWRLGVLPCCVNTQSDITRAQQLNTKHQAGMSQTAFITKVATQISDLFSDQCQTRRRPISQSELCRRDVIFLCQCQKNGSSKVKCGYQ